MTNWFPVVSNLSILNLDDNFLRLLGEIEESPKNAANLSAEEQFVVKHFQDNHSQSECGRYVVFLPKKTLCPSLGESRPQVVLRFLALERSLYSKSQFREFAKVLNEYLTMDQAEPFL